MAGIDYSELVSPLPHPGEILREDFMIPRSLTPGALARAMGLKDRTRIERLSRETQPVTADTALRLGRVFGTTAQYWINLQTQHDLSTAAIESREELARIDLLPALVVGEEEPFAAPDLTTLAKPIAPKRGRTPR